VFVGFGALIAVRSGGPSEAYEVAPVRTVLLTGMATIIAALAPVTISRYHLADHQVLALSSVVVLASYVGLMVLHARTPEFRVTAAVMRTHSRRWVGVAEGAAYVVFVGGPLLALIVIVLGVAPALESALYFTVVVALLVQAAWTLLWLAFMRRPIGT
jgi:hypothetical protein